MASINHFTNLQKIPTLVPQIKRIMSRDTNVTLAQLQQKMREYLGLEADNVMFEYASADSGIKLDLITVNPRHQQSFLFHSTIGLDKTDAAGKMWEHVRNYKDKENSYTIQWKSRSDKELQTSYFYAPNIYAALDKLNYGRDMNTISVYSVVLNPVS